MIRRLLTGFALALAVSAGSAAAQEEILSFESDIVVDRHGTLTVTETIRVRAEGRDIRRGIFRDFPVRYRTPSGYRRNVGFDITEIRRDGKEEPYHTEGVGDYRRIYIGDADVFLAAGEYTYTIRYETTRQLRYFDEFDELYWNVTGTGWRFPIRRAVARITLPQGADIRQNAAYTGYYGKQGQDYRVAAKGPYNITFETTRPLDSYQGLTVAVGFSKGVVAQPGVLWRFIYSLLDNLGLILLVGGTFGVAAYFLGKWVQIGRDPSGGPIIPLYEPPEGLSPAAVSYLHYQRFKRSGSNSTKAFVAALISLAVKGHLRLIDDGDKKVTVEAVNRDVGDLPAGEKAIWRRLLANREKFVFKSANASTVSSAQSNFKGAILGEYESVFFNNNYLTFAVGTVFSVLVLVGFLLLHQPAETEFGVILIALISGVLGSFLLAMGLRRLLGWLPGGGSIILGVLLTLIGALVIAPALLSPLMAFNEVLLFVPVAVVGIGIMNVTFFHLMRAPTVAGRKVMDDTEGFKLFLSVAEADRMNLIDAPDVSEPLFEKYLPYAVALGVEEPWSEAFADYLAKAAPNEAGYQPHWYGGSNFGVDRVSATTSNMVSSIGSSVSSAMPKSSGSSGSSGGGSSGGGGGGGGGGGW